MSAKHTFLAWETPCDNAIQKLVLLKLADNANDQGVSWPSIEYIAKHCNCSVRTVQRHIKDLCKRGLVSVNTRYTKSLNAQTSNIYTLHIASPCQQRDSGYPQGEGDTVTPPGDNLTPPGDTVTPDPKREPKRESKKIPPNPPGGDCVDNTQDTTRFTEPRVAALTEAGKQLFETLWQAWPNKKNRKRAMGAYAKFLKANRGNEEKATEYLINDIHKRRTMQQLGFGKMHMATYLNENRFTDSHEPEL